MSAISRVTLKMVAFWAMSPSTATAARESPALPLVELRDDVAAEHLDGRHHLVVGHRLGGHEELELVHPGRLVNGDAPQAGLGIAGHEDAAVDQGVGVDLVPQRGRDLPGAPGQIDLGRTGGGRTAGPVRLEIAREVRLEMLGHAAPRVDELLVQVRLILEVRAVRTEEGPWRLRGQLARRLVVRVAETH